MTEPYYDPQGFSLEIFKNRYTLHQAETWLEAGDRVAAHVAMAENGENIQKWKLAFAEALKKNLFMPGGRIWYGSGRPKGQILNCFVGPTEDSREGWGGSTSNLIVICGTGGGLGMNYSPIRPRGWTINGSGGTATGAVSLMRIHNGVGEEIKAGGGRRTALMMALSLSHPDIVEFLDAKLDLGQLKNANVSVIFDDDPEEFFEKVKKDAQLPLFFSGRQAGTVSAKKLWDKIIKNALTGGEPGLLNGYFANKMSNIWYYTPLICTNPCGEIWLAEYDCCCLGALVLPRFVRNGEIDYKLLGEIVRLGVRFLDNVLTVNNYPLPEIASMCKDIRRIGLGVMGLHDMLLLMGLKYNSDAGLELVDKVMTFIKNTAYEASTELAVEKGPFPKFVAEKFLKSGFTKTLKPSIRSLIRERGMRNCAALTIAPTGTTSIVSACTSGIEPMFAPAYERKFMVGDEKKTEIVVHPLFKQFVDSGKAVRHFQGAYDLKLRDHFEMQATCQKHLDNACSKTINVMPGTSADELSDMYVEFFPELKGVTIYPEGSRKDQPLTPLSLEEAIKYANGDATESSFAQDSCRNGACDI